MRRLLILMFYQREEQKRNIMASLFPFLLKSFTFYSMSVPLGLAGGFKYLSIKYQGFQCNVHY